ncbi:MAG: IS21 family transposase, partial [Erysipelotrichaceae bacterium]|nr:IS21 family transposase [Erysipelotrichaceae bacterium]
SYSKYKYIELTIDRTQPTLFNCMINAFKYCDGVPEEIWFDNMKTVVDRHDINTNEVTFNPKFLEFSRNCMFTPIACRPFRPCTKGLAENVAKIMERLRVYNDEFDSYDELNEIVIELNEQLNNEISQATEKVCREMFENEEKEYLLHVNLDQFNFKPDRQVRKVSAESMVNYDKHKYSVPVEYLGKLVEIEVIDNQLHIYYSGNEISCHDISDKKFNYHKNDLKQVIKGIYPTASDDRIDEMAENRLKGFDLIGERGGRRQ